MKFIKYRKINSTNEKAKELAKKGLFNLVVIADEQTAGKGRFKRKWVSSRGGLYFSILLKEKNADKIKYLTFIAALSVVKSLDKIVKIKTRIKWPNDVYFNGKKLCGILTETFMGKENFAVVGVGINVNQVSFPESVKDIATSLKIILKKEMCKEKVLNEFFRNFKFYYNKKNNEILKEVKNNSFLLDKYVKVKTIGWDFYGKVVDIDGDCNLVLKLKNNKVKKIIEGDISLA